MGTIMPFPGGFNGGFPGGFNGGSQFLILVANPFVETPHGQNYDPSRKLHFSL